MVLDMADVGGQGMRVAINLCQRDPYLMTIEKNDGLLTRAC